MKKIAALISSVLFSIACAWSCTSTPVALAVKDSGDHQVKVKAGKDFSIQLTSQLSTGYSWKIMEMPENLLLIKENVTTEEQNKTGGFDNQEFIFKASKSGGVIVFKYAAHWKKKPEYTKTSKITVQVE